MGYSHKKPPFWQTVLPENRRREHIRRFPALLTVCISLYLFSGRKTIHFVAKKAFHNLCIMYIPLFMFLYLFHISHKSFCF